MSRVIPGILMASGWVLLLFWGTPWLFWGIIVCGACVALSEYFRMTYPLLTGPILYATIFSSILPVLVSFFNRSDATLAAMVAGLLVLTVIALVKYTTLDDVSKYLSCGGFGGVYISLCMSHLVMLRFLPQGPFWLMLLIAIVAGSDTGAYYAGRALGHRKLCPQVSPKKTVEGVLGGLIAGVATAEGINYFCGQPAHPVPLFFAALLLIGIGIVGDLTESMIKRAVGVKDSGTILLGHGGLLDRIDSLLLTAPILYYLLHFRIL